MNEPVAYYIRGLLRQVNASNARRYLGISDSTGAGGVPGGGGGPAISAGANSQSTGTVIFSNSNGVSFGLNAGTLTASHNGLTSQSNQAASASNGSFTFQTLGFSNANNVTFGTSAGSIITASVAPAGAASLNVSAGTTSNNVTQLVFSNSNNASFGLNGSTITLSHEVSLNQVLDPSSDARFLMNTRQVQFQWGTNLSTFTTAAARQGLFEIDVIGNTDFASTSADKVDVLHIHHSTNNPYLHLLHVEAAGTNATGIHVEVAGAVGMEINRPISFDGGSVPMILGTSQSNLVSNLNAFYLEGARSSQFLTSQSNQAASASNGSFTFQTLNFSNANNVTFGTSAGGIVSASVAVLSLSGGAFGGTVTSILLGTSNGITLGASINAGQATITGSQNALTSQSNQAVSAANGSFTFQTVTFANSNGVSFSTGTQGLFASIADQTVGLYAVSNTTQSTSATADARSLSFAGAGVASVGASNGSVVISVPAGGGAAIRGIAAGASTATENTVNFSNSNGVSFGFGAGASSTLITASHNALTAVAFSANASSTFQTLTFQDSNNISFSNNAGAIRITHNLAGTSTAITGGASITLNSSGLAFNGTALAGTGTTFAGANISGSITQNSAGLNLSLSVNAPGGAGAARSYFQWPEAIVSSFAPQFSGSSKYLQPFRLPYDLSVSYLRLPLTLSCVGSNAATGTAANQTVGATVSSTFQLAFYSLGTGGNSRSLQSYFTTQHTWVQQLTIRAAGTGSHWSSGHTISYPMSSSASAAFTISSATTSASRTMNSSVISNFTNLRFLDLLMETSFSAGAWWMAFNSSTSISTSVSNWLSTQRILASNCAVQNAAASINLMNAATNSSVLSNEGLGDWSTNSIGTTTASIALSELSRRALNPIINFQMIRQA